jgi:hypothetical protein
MPHLEVHDTQEVIVVRAADALVLKRDGFELHVDAVRH